MVFFLKFILTYLNCTKHIQTNRILSDAKMHHCYQKWQNSKNNLLTGTQKFSDVLQAIDQNS